MSRRLARIFVVTLLCGALGLQWLALQSLAWTKMLVINSQKTSLAEAIARTFDGEHPCSLCKAVAKGKSSEKKSSYQASGPKVDLICPARVAATARRFAVLSYARIDIVALSSRPRPVVPPPRTSAG